MGGYGSGRKSGKSAVEDCLKLSLSKMLQYQQITEHDSVQTVSWTNRLNEELACFTFKIIADGTDLMFYIRELEQKINLSSTPLHFGGKRWWFHCPHCNRRCANLSYAKMARKFYCRVCLDLTYRSCQESHKFDGLYAHLPWQ